MKNQRSLPRPEYPRPDFVRKDWMNLNGEWQFAEDYSRSGRARGMQKADAPEELFYQKILVPFCRESELSGLAHKDFCECVWYRRTLEIPEAWEGKRVILHIGACDWETEVYVNGRSVGVHRGGFISFSFDITAFLIHGRNVLTLCAEDYLRTGNQPGGKQCSEYASYGCFYTRTTGIWQTVWMECVPQNHVKSVRVFPNPAEKTVSVECTVYGEGTLTASAFYQGKAQGSAQVFLAPPTAAKKADIVSECLKTLQNPASARAAVLQIRLEDLHLWEIGHGRLYDLKLTFGDDEIETYFGMREVFTRDGFVYLNGKRIFQRLVLDQGFYPDGIWTAPTADELLADIRRSKACGFDGARLHQKIFEPRFLYECDREGYIVWGEEGNWGMDISRAEAWANFLPEWVDVLQRDFNHPAIIGWCPLNETQKNQDDSFVRAVGAVTRAFDPTRPFIDASGWNHVPGISDIVDNHDYEQDPEVYDRKYAAMLTEGTSVTYEYYSKIPHVTRFVSEYGGIRWAENGEGHGWGYGNAPGTEEEFVNRFRGLTEVLLNNPSIGGLCYTQLTDVEQEVNGLYTYDRHPKFDPAVFKEILQRRSVIE